MSQAALDPGWSTPTDRPAPPSTVARPIPVPWRAPVALLAYLGLAVLLFVQAWAHPFTSSVGYRGDAELFMWFFSWDRFALAHGLNPVFTTYIDYPAGVECSSNRCPISRSRTPGRGRPDHANELYAICEAPE